MEKKDMTQLLCCSLQPFVICEVCTHQWCVSCFWDMSYANTDKAHRQGTRMIAQPGQCLGQTLFWQSEDVAGIHRLGTVCPDRA